MGGFKGVTWKPSTYLIEWFSEFQTQNGTKTGTIRNDKYHCSDKVAPHLYKREQYVIHYRSLKFIHELGVGITKCTG